MAPAFARPSPPATRRSRLHGSATVTNRSNETPAGSARVSAATRRPTSSWSTSSSNARRSARARTTHQRGCDRPRRGRSCRTPRGDGPSRRDGPGGGRGDGRSATRARRRGAGRTRRTCRACSWTRRGVAFAPGNTSEPALGRDEGTRASTRRTFREGEDGDLPRVAGRERCGSSAHRLCARRA